MAAKTKSRRWGRPSETSTAAPAVASVVKSEAALVIQSGAGWSATAEVLAEPSGGGEEATEPQSEVTDKGGAEAVAASRIRPNGSKWGGNKGRGSNVESPQAPLKTKGSTKPAIRYEKLDMPGADVRVFTNSFGGDESDQFLRALRRTVDWQRRPIVTPSGETTTENRYTCFFADHPELTYSYSGRVNDAVEWLPELLTIKQRCEELIKEAGLGTWKFSGCLANRYDSDRHTLGYHADDEPSMEPRTPIASVSFGASRRFDFKKRKDPSDEAFTSVQLTDGCLLVMAGETQMNWLHAVPAAKENEPGLRINLTFRIMRPESGS